MTQELTCRLCIKAQKFQKTALQKNFRKFKTTNPSFHDFTYRCHCKTAHLNVVFAIIVFVICLINIVINGEKVRHLTVKIGKNGVKL